MANACVDNITHLKKKNKKIKYSYDYSVALTSFTPCPPLFKNAGLSNLAELNCTGGKMGMCLSYLMC